MDLKGYQRLAQQLSALIDGEEDLIANLANVSALLNMELDDINWVGFYLYKNDQLVLGPFQGKPACVRIDMGKGVCGTSALTKQVQRINDVHQFDGHIACDSQSKSEIVIPFFNKNQLIGVLDIDSPLINRFSEIDEEGLIGLMKTIENTL